VNRGIKILLKRMDSHPEEFRWFRAADEKSEWDWIVSPLVKRKYHPTVPLCDAPYPFLSDAEVSIVVSKFFSIQEEAFNEQVMRQLLEADGG
jgi:hypothetical protein